MEIDIKKLLKKYLPKFIKAFQIDYSIGSAVGITNAKIQGKQTNMNPLNLSKKDQEAFIDNIETLIKDVNSETAKKISLLTNQSITERWDNKMLADKLKGLFNKEVPGHFNYKNRFKTIAQNTSFDLMSVGSNNTSIELGATKKWIFNTMDNKTAEDSMISHAKYGTEEKAIPVNEPFSYMYKGKERTFMFGRDRVNDRSMTTYVFE